MTRIDLKNWTFVTEGDHSQMDDCRLKLNTTGPKKRHEDDTETETYYDRLKDEGDSTWEYCDRKLGHGNLWIYRREFSTSSGIKTGFAMISLRRRKKQTSDAKYVRRTYTMCVGFDKGITVNDFTDKAIELVDEFAKIMDESGFDPTIKRHFFILAEIDPKSTNEDPFSLRRAGEVLVRAQGLGRVQNGDGDITSKDRGWPKSRIWQVLFP